MRNDISHPQGNSAFRPHGSKTLRLVGLTIAGIGLAVLFALVFGILVKVLWNWLMPSIFGLGKITFWQAFGIVLLAKLLFGSFGHGHTRKDRHESFESGFQGRIERFIRPKKTSGAATTAAAEEENEAKEEEEEQSPTPGNGRKWSHFRQYWQDEGRAAFEAYVQRMTEKEGKES